MKKRWFKGGQFWWENGEWVKTYYTPLYNFIWVADPPLEESIIFIKT